MITIKITVGMFFAIITMQQIMKMSGHLNMNSFSFSCINLAIINIQQSTRIKSNSAMYNDKVMSSTQMESKFR